jgi:hypothetical protein
MWIKLFHLFLATQLERDGLIECYVTHWIILYKVSYG